MIANNHGLKIRGGQLGLNMVLFKRKDMYNTKRVQSSTSINFYDSWTACILINTKSMTDYFYSLGQAEKYDVKNKRTARKKGCEKSHDRTIIPIPPRKGFSHDCAYLDAYATTFPGTAQVQILMPWYFPGVHVPDPYSMGNLSTRTIRQCLNKEKENPNCAQTHN